MTKGLTVLLLIFSVFSRAEQMPDFPFLTVSASAEKAVAPDLVHVSFSIVAVEKDPVKATDIVYGTGNELMAFFKDLGISKDDIEAHSITKNVIRKRNKDYQPVQIEAYEVEQAVKVTLRKLDNFQSLSDKLLTTKHIDDVDNRFDVSNRSAIEQQLVRDAGNQAKQKAKNLASGVGVKLGKVYAVSQERAFGSYAKFKFANQSYEAIAVSGKRRQIDGLFIPKEIKLSQSINVIYQIKP
ncbi:SIMPL domain-containing protein [Thalassotalea agarivorans]|uniref:Oxidative stress defense protein n=1 Tax=Thalassotalea agarivorans TaxID=349064 RepID=A0A1I0AM66_THASX|nr:SIMPL domain-containing protein [Thalassotalea agarivorans]SES94462.1 Protein of unknown function [Thalassotalea agarivorans]